MNRTLVRLIGLALLSSLSISSFIPYVSASLFFSSSNSPPSPPSQAAAQFPSNQSQGPPTSLSPGTATSIVDKPPPIVSTAVNTQIEPFLTRTAAAYVYTTSFGLYKFSRLLPYILSVSAANNTRDFVLGSTFLVNSTTPLDIANSTVLLASNYNFTVRYSLLSGGTIVGKVTIGVAFFKSAPPKITAKLDSVLTDFNLEWIVVPSVGFASFANGSVFNVMGYPSQTRLRNQLSYLEMGDANDTRSWRFWGKIDWSSSPRGTLYVTRYQLNAILSPAIMVAFPRGQAIIDPSLSASTSNYFSALATQRKLFFYNALYWAFWFDASTSNVYYRTSLSGLSNDWSPSFQVATLPNSGGEFDVAQSKSRVFLAWLDTSLQSLMVQKGFISGSAITWGASVVVSSGLTNPATASANVAIGSDDYVWVGGASGSNFVLYRSSDTTGDTYPSIGTGSFPYSSTLDGYRVLPLANGRVFMLYSSYTGTSISWWFYGVGGVWSNTQTWTPPLVTSEAKFLDISSVVTSDQVIHLLYRAGDGTIKSAYTSDYSNWITEATLSTSPAFYPTLTVDALDGLHGFWVQGNAIKYSIRTPSLSSNGYTWSVASSPFGTSVTNLNGLTSAYSAGTTVPILWNNGTGPTYYNIYFGALSVPLSTTGVPSQPWNRPGLSPFQQYSSQLGEYVSPGNLLLYLRQTDLGIPGRGLDLSITRVYSTPQTWLSLSALTGLPLNYESYPYANLGIGWSLNFPWIGAKYLHLWDGQQYSIKWVGDVFENHNGEHFSLRRYVSGGVVNSYSLASSSSSVYTFDSTGRLLTIVDATGNNQITFAYDGSGRISTITDTLSRVATFSYDSNSMLASVTYGGRTVIYTYVVANSGPNLVQVTDPKGRITSFTYHDSYDSNNKWLISEIDYPSGARSTYASAKVFLTSDVYSYVVILQNVYDKSTLVKSVSYDYAILNGRPIHDNVTFSDGTSIQGFTSYQFLPDISSMIVTDEDAGRNQLRSIRYWYGPEGEVQQQDIYRGNTAVKTYSEYYYFDEWGNLIYSKDASGHETFASFAGTNSQNQFYGPGNLAQTTSGEVFHDYFLTYDLNPNFWSEGGPLGGRYFYSGGGRLYMQGYSSTGSWQTAWVVSKNTFSYPFYIDVRSNLQQNPGQVTMAADLEISPQLTATGANPHDNPDLFRVILNDGPYYRVQKKVAGVGTTYDSGLVSGGTISVRWVIELLSSNTVTVWLDKGKGLELFYTTSSLGLASSFTPAYIYLVFYNLNTQRYGAYFDYVVSNTNSFVTVNGLQVGQRAELYDSTNSIVDAAKLSVAGAGVTLSSRSLARGSGSLKIYDADRTLQYTSTVREFRGGDVFSYSPPYTSQGLSKTTSGFKKSVTVYLDDTLPSGATTIWSYDGWNWVLDAAQAVSGNYYHTSPLFVAGHEHGFYGATTTITPSSGQFMVQYINVPAQETPSEIMLEYHVSNGGGSWEHRAFWGLDMVPFGIAGTVSRRYMGGIPSQTGQWLMLTVKADDVGIAGYTVDGLSWVLYDGAASWDFSAIGDANTGSVVIQGLSAGQRVEVFDAANRYIASTTDPSGSSQVSLDLYTPDPYTAKLVENVFPFAGYFRVYDTNGYTLLYQSPIMQNIYGGDVYTYTPPKFYPNALSPIYAQSVTASSSEWVNPSYILGAPDGQQAYVPWNADGGCSRGGTITVDMGRTIPLGNIYLDFSSVGNAQIPVAVSPDNSVWTTVSTVQIPFFNTGKLQQFSAGTPPLAFRYVKLTLASTSCNTEGFDAIEVLASNVRAQPTGSLTFQTGRMASPQVPMQSYTKYDPTGYSLETKTLHGGNWIFTYQSRDLYGNAISQTDANSQVTNYGYSSLYQSGYLTSTSTTVGGATIYSSLTYDFNTGLPLSAVDPNGFTTSYLYDSLLRPTKVTYPGTTIFGQAVTFSSSEWVNPSYILGAPDGKNAYVPWNADGGCSAGATITVDMGSIASGGVYIDFWGIGNAQIPVAVSSDNVNWLSLSTLSIPTYNPPVSIQYFAGTPAQAFRYVKLTLQSTSCNTEGFDAVEVHTGVQSSGNYAYNDATNLLTLTDENGHVVNKYFDSLGRLIQVDRLNINGTVYSSEYYTYNWQNQISTYKNAAGFTYSYSYDFLGRPIKVLNPDGTYRMVQYDDINNVVIQTDENNHQKQYVRDALNRITAVKEVCSSPTCLNPPTQYGQALTSYSSAWVSPASIVGAPDGNWAYVSWNSADGATITVDLGHSVSAGDVYLDYRAWGTLTMPVALSSDNTNWNTLSTVSVPWLGSFQALQLFAGHASQAFRYVRLTLQSMGGNTQEFDAIEVKNSNAPYYWTQYQYNEVGDLIQISDAIGQVTKNTYDDLNRLVRVDYPDSTYASFTYDNNGNMMSRTDPNGKTTTLTYDGLGRLTKKTYPDLSTVTYSYDKAGNLLSVVNPQASITYTYDPRNRQLSESLVVGTYTPIVYFGYDKAGNLASIVYPDGANVTYAYDAQNRVIQVGSYASFTYTKDDKVNTVTSGNGVQTGYTYDIRGRLSRILTTNAKKTLLDLSYTFDNTGNVLTIGTETYTYDFLNRITNSTGPWGSIGYSYDAVGNRLSKTEGGVTTNYGYGAYNKLLSAGSTQYRYNNNGDLANKTTGSTTWFYAYTFEDKLASVTQGSSTIGQYFYDGNEMRVKKIENGQTTINLSVGLSAINEYVVETGTATKYMYANGEILAKQSGSTVSYYVQDSLGSTRLVTSASVKTLYSTNYKPFGLEYGATGTETYKFTGQIQDSATGLYYLHARYYDPDLGRFTSADPIGAHQENPQTLNQYTYAGNNPLRYIDPSGEDWWSTLTGAWNTFTGAVNTATSAVGNWWGNLDPNWKTAIILGLATVAVIATAGLAGIALAPIVTAALVGGTLSGGIYVGTSYASGKTPTISGFAAAFATGAFLGAVGGVAAKVASTAATTLGNVLPSWGSSIATPGLIKGAATFAASAFSQVVSGQRDLGAILVGAGISALSSGASSSLADDAFPLAGRPASSFTTFAKAVFTPWSEGTTNAQAYVLRQVTGDFLSWEFTGLVGVTYAALSGR